MLEKEIKILDIDKQKLEKQLLGLGAHKTFEGFIHDIYYDFVDGNTHKLDENRRLFRVRKKGETHLYTIKRKRQKKSEGGVKGMKMADEGESTITDVESFTKVLEKYGMKKTREKKKFRTSYKLGAVEFDIDTYEGIPDLLEIEAGTKKEILDYIEKLQLQDHVQKKFGSRGLYKFYNKDYNYIKED